MHLKLLKELLNLDNTSQYIPTSNEEFVRHKNPSEKMQKKVKITQRKEPGDISSNLMKVIVDEAIVNIDEVIVDANEPIDLDLESISDYSDSSISSSSATSDSFYEL